MAAVPAVVPVTAPVALPMVRMEDVVLQVPPDVPSRAVMELPVHTEAGPLIAVGDGLTVMSRVVRQLVVPIVYVMVTVPAASGVTTPEVAPTVAIPVDPLVHVPPVVGSVTVAGVPIHRLDGPLIAPGPAVTVSVRDTIQPVPNE